MENAAGRGSTSASTCTCTMRTGVNLPYLLVILNKEWQTLLYLSRGIVASWGTESLFQAREAVESMPLLIQSSMQQGIDLTQTRVATRTHGKSIGRWGSCPVPHCWIRELAHTNATAMYVRLSKLFSGVLGLLYSSYTCRSSVSCFFPSLDTTKRLSSPMLPLRSPRLPVSRVCLISAASFSSYFTPSWDPVGRARPKAVMEARWSCSSPSPPPDLQE